MKKPGFYFSLVTLVALILGYLASLQINDFLNIGHTQKKSPELNSYQYNEIDTAQTNALNLRMFSLGGVGVLPDTANWGSNYEHNAHRFEDVFLAESPFINEIAFERVRQQLEEYLNKMVEFDYNAMLLGSYLPFIDFEKVGNGREVYAGDDTVYIERQNVLREYYGKMMDLANQKGIDIYATTDMVALSPPLKAYLLKRFGSFDTENPEFWAIYKAGLAELFERMPQIKGLMIRIGEAGTVYNRPGSKYTSELLVKKDDAVKLMIQSFLETAEQYNRDIIFRSWSVGVGTVGDMHTNPETYHYLFDEFKSDKLIISTKYCSGDFYAWLPFNPTLQTGSHRRIIELQCRREFEGMNAFPNFVAPLSQQALQLFSESNPNIEGLWVWPQSGGPLRAGPLSIYPFHGFNVITDANVYAHGRLLQNPNVNLHEVAKDWAGLSFGEDSILTSQVANMLLESHEIMRKGMYITEFAKHDVRALGLEPPPMMWIFEWDLVGGSSSVMGTIYEICKGNLESSIEEGYAACKEILEKITALERVKELVSRNHQDFSKLIESMHYQANLFMVLAHYRAFFLRYFSWLDTGSEAPKTQWHEAVAT